MAKLLDWESVENDYRAGLKTLRQIADEHGVSHVAINKRAKRDGWVRDLSAKINAAAEEKVTKALVTKEVTKDRLVTDRAVVEANAQSIADKVLAQRKDVSFARDVVQSLFIELKGQIENIEEVKEIAKVLADGDEKEMSATLKKVISLAGRTDTAKKLSESLRILIELERKVLRIKDEPEAAGTIVLKADQSIGAADAYMRMLGKK